MADYERRAPVPPRFYLSYLVTSRRVDCEPGSVRFVEPFAELSAERYPVALPIVVAGAMWGRAGSYTSEIVMVDGPFRTILHRGTFRIEIFPEEVQYQVPVPLEIAEPGSKFLEWWVGGQRVGRRALYLREVSLAEFAFYGSALALQQPRIMVSEHALFNDDVLENGASAQIDYFAICQDARREDALLALERRFLSVYWAHFPLRLRATLALSIRVATGRHQIVIEIRNASRAEAIPVSGSTLVAASSCVAEVIHGEVIVNIPEPGIYLFNVVVDGRFVASTLLWAETDPPQYGYNLHDEELERMRAGELMVLLKGGKQRE